MQLAFVPFAVAGYMSLLCDCTMKSDVLDENQQCQSFTYTHLGSQVVSNTSYLWLNAFVGK